VSDEVDLEVVGETEYFFTVLDVGKVGPQRLRFRAQQQSHSEKDEESQSSDHGGK
jgi:hypothetical protein